MQPDRISTNASFAGNAIKVNDVATCIDICTYGYHHVLLIDPGMKITPTQNFDEYVLFTDNMVKAESDVAP
jgi:hypothetical protein